MNKETDQFKRKKGNNKLNINLNYLWSGVLFCYLAQNLKDLLNNAI
jgi:hypothetical protein